MVERISATLLGTGTPNPDPKRRGPGTVIRAGRQILQVDCGSGNVHQLIRAGISPAEIDHLFITHLHSDHYIDLDHFVITRWILGARSPLNIHGPTRLKGMMEAWMEVHAYDIELRIKTRRSNKQRPKLVVHEIDEGSVPNTDGLEVTAFDVEHFPVDQPFGFRFRTGDQTIVVSGDTCPCENLIRHARHADLLIHECVDYSNIEVKHGSGWASREERISYLHKVHTLPEGLGDVARDAAPTAVATTHMLANSDPISIKERIAASFSGQVTIGEDLLTL